MLWFISVLRGNFQDSILNALFPIFSISWNGQSPLEGNCKCKIRKIITLLCCYSHVIRYYMFRLLLWRWYRILKESLFCKMWRLYHNTQHNKVVIDSVLIFLILCLHHNRMFYINCKCVGKKATVVSQLAVVFLLWVWV